MQFIICCEAPRNTYILARKYACYGYTYMCPIYTPAARDCCDCWCRFLDEPKVADICTKQSSTVVFVLTFHTNKILRIQASSTHKQHIKSIISGSLLPPSSQALRCVIYREIVPKGTNIRLRNNFCACRGEKAACIIVWKNMMSKSTPWPSMWFFNLQVWRRSTSRSSRPLALPRWPLQKYMH